MRAAQSRPEVVDSQGRPVPLGAVLGKGGEGAVLSNQVIERAFRNVANSAPVSLRKPLLRRGYDGWRVTADQHVGMARRN
jgi:hypothetical protein